MPSLQVFQRRTIFAGDDLQPTVIINVFFRTFQFLVLALPILLHLIYETGYFIKTAQNRIHQYGERWGDESYVASYLFGGDVYTQECNPKSHYFPLLLYMHLCMTTCHTCLSLSSEFIIYKIASIGTPTQPHLRLSLGKVLEKKWIWLSIVGNFIVFIFGIGSICYKRSYFDCREIISQYEDNDPDDEMMNDVGDNWFSNVLVGRTIWWIAFSLLVSSQIVEGFVASVALISLFQKEKSSIFVNQNYHDMDAQQTIDFDNTVLDYDHTLQGLRYNMHHHQLAEEMWDNRCRNFCKCAAFSTCYLFGGRELVDGVVGDYGQISRALADYFEDGGVLDLVPSDLAIGFLMLQRVQRQRVLEARCAIEEELRQGHGINSLMRSSSSYSLDPDSHNFSLDRSEGKIASALDDHAGFFDEKVKSEGPRRHVIERGRAPTYYETQPSLHVVDNMLVSVLQPIPFSRNILINDDRAPNGLYYDHSDMSSGDASALMLRMISDNAIRDYDHWYEPTTRKVFHRDDEFDRNLIVEGARFARHSLAIYTWLLYFYMHPITGIPRLLSDRVKECFKRENKGANVQGFDADVDRKILFSNNAEDNIIGDNWLHIHKNALLAHSGLDESDLVYANFENKYNQMPYCIVIDHKWQSVVVSIRGTLSLEDCVVDVLVDPEPLDELGHEYGFDSDGQYCHSGVVACIKNIMRDLKRHNILDSLLSGVGAKYSHYKLRFTGHSLGAGCATLLGYMFRRSYPDLRVIAISPPGGFLSYRMAKECSSFVTAFVLDSDLVPRLSVASMEQMRNEVLDLIGRIKVPKMQVAKTVIVQGVKKGIKDTDDVGEITRENSSFLFNTGSVLTRTDFHVQLERFQEIQRRRKEARGVNRDIKLFPPGKIVHLVKTGENSSCIHSMAKCLTCCTSNVGSEYTPVWADNADFNEILVSPTMGFDHFPNRVCVELEKVANHFGIDTSIGSTSYDKQEGDRIRNIHQQIL